ncbi:MAG TPA: M56 family metallopeptidase [Polyangiaceae bacterium]|nr:M56 family metallopeptidase [Polyangiaceae bacterium]
MIDRLGHALAAWLLPVNAWTAAMLACAVLLDRVLARRARASLRIALYVPVALRVLVPLSWSLHVARLPQAATIMPLQVLSASSASATTASTGWHATLAVVYLAVVATLVVRAVARRRQLARTLAVARPVRGVEAPCPVLVHRDRGPMVVGLWSPRIVLPEAMLGGASGPALSCILGHESAHVRRGDPWLAAFMEAMLVVAWPVLPLWIAAARVRHLVELACDEVALSGADAAARRRYGHLLLDVAEQGSLAFAGAEALHFGSTLRARIEAIALQRPWPRVVQTALVGAAVAGFVACSSAGPGAMPQASGQTRTAAAGEGQEDDYGYKYETDPLSTSSQQAATSNPSHDSRGPEGRLAPEVIQNVVRQNFGRFRTCYENGLKRDAKLQGTVTVKYVICPDGSTCQAADEGSTLPDQQVVQCVVAGFSQVAYPPPQGGYVTVIYPVEFAPGE